MKDFPPDDENLVVERVTAGIYTDETLASLLASHANAHPDAPAIVDLAGTLGFAALADEVARTAGGLGALGIGRGDIVAVQLPNCREFIVTYLAITALGAVMQTLHMPYRSAELKFLLGHSGAKAVICLASFKDYSPAKEIALLGDTTPDLSSIVVVGESRDEASSGFVRFGELRQADAETDLPRPQASDPFLLLYTSGTTANPKGVPLRYRQFLSNAAASVPELGIGRSSRLLSVAPLSHLYGLFVFHLAFCAGAATVLLPAFDPAGFGETVERHKVSEIFAAPAHMIACRNAGIFEANDFSSVRFACLSGSPVAPDLASAVDESLPNGVTIQLWGMSELQAGTYTRPGDPVSLRHNTAGRPSPNTEIRIVDDSDAALPSGKEGRLQARGPSLFSGYLANDDANSTAFAAGGWFETGDRGIINSDGALVITGREKEIINRGGVKFHPGDVEHVVNTMANVVQSALVSYPDEALGERAGICVVADKATEAPTLEDICGALEGAGIAKYKWPERLALVDSLPMTPTQKIMRAKLAEIMKHSEGRNKDV